MLNTPAPPFYSYIFLMFGRSTFIEKSTVTAGRSTLSLFFGWETYIPFKYCSSPLILYFSGIDCFMFITHSQAFCLAYSTPIFSRVLIYMVGRLFYSIQAWMAAIFSWGRSCTLLRSILLKTTRTGLFLKRGLMVWYRWICYKTE